MPKEIKEKKECSEMIFDKWNWRGRSCLRKAIIKRNDKSYCKIHDPEYIRKKDKEREEKYKRQSCECGHHFDYAWYQYCSICGLKRSGRNK